MRRAINLQTKVEISKIEVDGIYTCVDFFLDFEV
jgi:hypothetical protein